MSIEVFQNKFWSLNPEQTLKILETDEANGLDEEEARRRLEIFGLNKIPEKKFSRTQILFNQLKSPLIFILSAAAALTVFLKSYADAIFIAAAVIINTALGFYQESKAENSVQKLKTYFTERVRVIRSGREFEENVETLVPGDIINLTTGNRAPADCRLISSSNLFVDEAVITGESKEVEKLPSAVGEECLISDQSSMIFTGTSIVSGFGSAAVTATGPKTEIGRIALLVEKTRETTPLQKAINRFSVRASSVLFMITAAVFVFGVLSGRETIEMFLMAVAVSVAAVPEGLPISLTIILAVGVEFLAKKRAVVKKLLAAETLGDASLIITDKTGTLTEAKLELIDIITSHPKEKVFEFALLAVEGFVENPQSPKEEWRIVGRPLEAALIKAAADHSVFLKDLKPKVKILDKHPFDSRKKFSAVNVLVNDSKFWIYVGAPEFIADKIRITEAEKIKIAAENSKLADKGFRVLGVAAQDKFFGFLVFRDKIRSSVKASLEQISRAGVKVVIATGDHKGTASALANEVGIAITNPEAEVIDGKTLNALSDTELSYRLNQVKVFARVSPEDKFRIVRLFKEKGEIVAMTGDGVNDAPALKEADIGAALGSGTDVAKGAADLVILDDNFETIAAAIAEGRKIMDNIKKSLVYLLAGSLDELILIFGALLSGAALPLNARQILWLNFLIESLPALAFAFEKENSFKEMTSPKKSEKLFTFETKFLIFFIGISMSLFLLAIYLSLIFFGEPEAFAKTFIFSAFGIIALTLALSLKNFRKSIFSYNPFSNPFLVFAVGVGIALIFFAVYQPDIQILLQTTALPASWLFKLGIVFAANLIVLELGKFLFRFHLKTAIKTDNRTQ